MKKLSVLVLVLVCFAAVLQSCGSETESEKNSINIDYDVTDDQGEKSSGEVTINLDKPNEALNEISKALEGVDFNIKKDGEEIEIVNFRELKKLMPEKIDGMKRKSHEGQTTGFGGMKLSTAEAAYRDGDRRLDLTITDTGGLGAALMGMAMWKNLEIDKEDDNGFERTTEINGHKAFVKYDKRNERSEISVLYNDRIVAVAKGRGISFSDLGDILEDLDIDEVE